MSNEKNVMVTSFSKSKDKYKTKDPDVIFFRRSAKDKDQFEFDMFEFLDRDQQHFVELPDMDVHKWLVILFEEDDKTKEDGGITVEYFKAGIGDQFFYVENHMKAKSEGMVARMCERGFEATIALLEGINADFPDILAGLKMDQAIFLEELISKGLTPAKSDAIL